MKKRSFPPSRSFERSLSDDTKKHRLSARIRGERRLPGIRFRIRGGRTGLFRPSHPYLRRVTVKCSFKKNDPKHPWSRHGFYLMRESAIEAAFDSESDSVDLAHRLDDWQTSGDRHMFRVILSPEDGDKLDLVSFTREYVDRMEKELGTKLEWGAVEHRNTDNPHVHLILRGKDEHGFDLVLSRDYIRTGMRSLAQGLATERLGFRTPAEMLEAREKVLDSPHLTEIDRSLLKRAGITPSGARILILKPSSGDPEKKERRRQDEDRLNVLEQFGVAKRLRGDTWQLADNSEDVLKGMGLMRDIIKRRAQAEKQASRPGLPLAFGWAGSTLKGKVVSSGPVSETSEDRYVFIEGTDGRLHYEVLSGFTGSVGANVTLARGKRGRARLVSGKKGVEI